MSGRTRAVFAGLVAVADLEAAEARREPGDLEALDDGARRPLGEQAREEALEPARGPSTSMNTPRASLSTQPGRPSSVASR